MPPRKKKNPYKRADRFTRDAKDQGFKARSVFKLEEANRQRMYTAAAKDLEFWLGEVEHMLETDDYGKDLATVQNLNKKHQLLEADIKAHEERVRDLNEQADVFIESGLWDVDSIRDKKQSINDRCVDRFSSV